MEKLPPPPTEDISVVLVRELCTMTNKLTRRNSFITVLAMIVGLAVGSLVTLAMM